MQYCYSIPLLKSKLSAQDETDVFNLIEILIFESIFHSNCDAKTNLRSKTEALIRMIKNVTLLKTEKGTM